MYQAAKNDIRRSVALVGQYLRTLIESLPWIEVALFGLLIFGIGLS
jgi:hypothetical protein